MKTLDSKLFEKKEVKREELQKVFGRGIDTPCGPAYDGDVQYKDHCADDGTMTYVPC